MGNSSSGTTSNQFQTDAKEPLVTEPDLNVLYGALQEQINDSRYIGNSSLLDPSGHLSKELQEVLDDEFMKYSNGLLVITRNQLKLFLIACYPNLFPIRNDNNENNNENKSNDMNNDEMDIKITIRNDNNNVFYTDRVNYILQRYGKPFKDVRNHFAKILNITIPESKKEKDKSVNEAYEPVAGGRNTVTMVDTHNNGINGKNSSNNNNNTNNSKSNIEEDPKEREDRIVKESLEKHNDSNKTTKNENITHLERKKDNKQHTKHNNNSHTKNKSGHSVSIQEDQNVIERTIHCDWIDGDEIVLPKTKFLLFYRKSCFDREMMVRLELNELGYSQFRGMLVDRSKSIDVLAYKVQQLRNQEQTHLEEKERILSSKPASECADLLTNYINSNADPFDLLNDSDNLYRKRRPIKFGRCCYSLCPCIVCLARCCC